MFSFGAYKDLFFFEKKRDLFMDYIEMLKRARASVVSRDTGRFEVPAPVVMPAGRQTTVRNFLDIAKAVRREPKHIAKYLFKELAVPGEIKGAELFLQGKFPSSILARRVDDYIKEFVLCHECSKPDTLVQKADRYEFLKCEACGARRPLRQL